MSYFNPINISMRGRRASAIPKQGLNSLLHVPKNINPSKKTWMWIGLGTLVVAVAGVAYYRNKACDIPRISKNLQAGVVGTVHPAVFSAKHLEGMRPGDKVGVAVGIWDIGEPYNLRPEYSVKVLPGQLDLDDRGVESVRLDCPLLQPTRGFTTVGPVLEEGGPRRGYGQYVGYFFPVDKIGLVLKRDEISPYAFA